MLPGRWHCRELLRRRGGRGRIEPERRPITQQHGTLAMHPTLRVILSLLMSLPVIAAATAVQAAETLRSTDEFSTADGLIADRTSLPGAAVYARHCAQCHEGGVAKAPHMQWLELMPPAAIVNALSKGVMAEQGRALSAEQHLQVAEYITRRSLANGLPEIPLPAQCSGEAARFDLSRPAPAVGWGHDARRFVPAEAGGISAADLKSMELKWAYAFPFATRGRSQPAIGMGAVFVGSEDGRVYAFDLKTGCARWIFEASAEVRTGVVLSAGERPMLYFGDILAKFYAVDALTGKLLWSQRVDDHPSATLTGTPLLHDGRLYVPVSSLEVVPAANPAYPCCTFRGKLRALDARTGEFAWDFHPIPEAPKSLGRTSAGTERFGPSGTPIWANPVVDTRRGVLYIGSGENYSSPADENSDAIFAVDLATGKRVWQSQTIAGDAWNVACMMADNPNCPQEKGPDFDHSSSILLIDLPDGKQLLVTGHKNGEVYGLDPDRKGELLWRTKIARGSIQGGVHFGMAVEGTTLYVPVNDMNNTRNGEFLDPALARPGMHAVDLVSGKVLWSKVQPNVCGEGRPVCDPGISAAVTAIPGAVIAGHLDGHVRAYAKADGQLLWDVDTAREFEGVNGLRGRGGSMSGPGAAVGEGYVALNSGYGLYFHEPGNLFLVFGPRATP